MSIQVKELTMGHIGYSNGVEGWLYGPNSAGGVSVSLSFCNTGTKTIKYAMFDFVPVNSVGDVVSDRISGDSVKGGRYTGFVEPNTWSDGVIWENLWYNNSISSVRIKEVILQYSDGTEETIPNSQIQYVQESPNSQIKYVQGSGGGCYVATAVYGSYDCPEVWTLRRYRDYDLAETWYGRAFIKTYYTISPTLVKWFGHTEWFKKMWRGRLDQMVRNLQKKGYESTPYDDRNW